MRQRGYDNKGNCTFAIPLWHEFLNKEECIQIINKYIDLSLNVLSLSEEKKTIIKEIQGKISKFYDKGKESLSFNAYVLHHKGICFYLCRSTKMNGWNHFIKFCTYNEMDYELSQSIMYIPLVTKMISNGEQYERNHKFDQKMTDKYGSDCTMYAIPLGSTVYEELEKVKNVKNKNDKIHDVTQDKVLNCKQSSIKLSNGKFLRIKY